MQPEGSWVMNDESADQWVLKCSPPGRGGGERQRFPTNGNLQAWDDLARSITRACDGGRRQSSRRKDWHTVVFDKAV